jgi:hypothetical protein
MFLQANVVHKVNSDLTTCTLLMEGVPSPFLYAKTSFDGEAGPNGRGAWVRFHNDTRLI